MIRIVALSIVTTVFCSFFSIAQISCSFDNNQGAPNTGYLLWPEGITTYTLVDPTEDGGAGSAGCSSTGDFVLTSFEMSISDVIWHGNNNPNPGDATFQFGIYGLQDQLDPCAGVGSNIWLSPIYSKSVGDTITDYFLPTGGLPLNEKFFITWKLLSWTGTEQQVMTPVWDGLLRPSCSQFYSGNDGVNFVSHEDFFNSNFGWMDIKVNGYYNITEFAEIQYINASADTEMSTVDIRINGEFPDPSFDNLDFKCATSGVILPAGVNEITVNPSTSIDDSDPIAVFTEQYVDGDKLIGVFHGINSSSGYSPSTTVVPLSLNYVSPAQASAEQGGETDLAFFHAVTDVSQVDLQIVSGPAIANGINYGSFDGYVGINTSTIEIVLNETGLGMIQDYTVPLDDLEMENLAGVFVVLGFNDPSVNSNGEPLGIWLSRPSGGCLEEMTFINGLNILTVPEFNIYPNPSFGKVYFEDPSNGQISNIEVMDIAGALVYSASVKNKAKILDLHFLESGQYFINFVSGNGDFIGRGKLVKTN